MNSRQPVALGDGGNASDPSQAEGAASLARGGSYQIKVNGRLDEHWSEWLAGLAITYDGHGNTLLTGSIPDQAALYGVLLKIRDLGLRLISLNQSDSGEKG